MAKVTGLGGIFYKVEDSERSAAWYREMLGVGGEWGAMFPWKKDETGEAFSLFSQFKATSDYFDPNPYYFPWSVTVGGVSLPTNSIEIYRFINKVYPDFLTDKNKMPVLHTIVKQLY